MKVRPENPKDYAAIRQIHIDAFASHPYSHQTEHLIVEALRSANALLISLIAEIDERVVGHIAFSPAKVNGEDFNWVILGPVGVYPHLQRKGIGKALINEGLKKLRAQGKEGCILVGDPKYYSRFGFKQDPSVTYEGGVPHEYVLCLPFTRKKISGEVSHHKAFSVS